MQERMQRASCSFSLRVLALSAIVAGIVVGEHPCACMQTIGLPYADVSQSFCESSLSGGLVHCDQATMIHVLARHFKRNTTDHRSPSDLVKLNGQVRLLGTAFSRASRRHVLFTQRTSHSIATSRFRRSPNAVMCRETERECAHKHLQDAEPAPRGLLACASFWVCLCSCSKICALSASLTKTRVARGLHRDLLQVKAPRPARVQSQARSASPQKSIRCILQTGSSSQSWTCP